MEYGIVSPEVPENWLPLAYFAQNAYQHDVRLMKSVDSYYIERGLEWDKHGLRGYTFIDSTKSRIVVAFKGMSVSSPFDAPIDPYSTNVADVEEVH